MLRQLTAEQFLDERHNLPDGGQWAELVEGIPICLSAPDLQHGNVVLNLSKHLAEYVQRTEHGYPCFDLGVRVVRDPDTIRFPAIAYFTTGPRFAESDKPYSDAVPVLSVLLLSTPDRREQWAGVTRELLEFGVRLLWTIDPAAGAVTVVRPDEPPVVLADDEVLSGSGELPDFRMPVRELFVEPAWWSGR